MNILLLNLTRFGDLIQSQAAVSGLKDQGHAVALVCLENFLPAARLLRRLDLAVALPGAALLAGLAGNDGWPAALADLATWRDDLQERFPYDLVCNLTPSLTARLLALFLSRRTPCRGFALDREGYNADSTAWAAFMQSASAERGVSPFNVADIFRKTAHAWPSSPPLDGNAALAPLPESDLAAMRRRLAGEFRKKTRAKGHAGTQPPLLALQLGASEERRQWPLRHFAALGDQIWKEQGLMPVLLGSHAERPLAEAYAAMARHPFIDMCGKTRLEELACLLACMRLLVTNDTGTMHLAAGLGLPCLAIFLATAQPFDTGPYLAGCCCLEPDLDCHPCRFGRTCDKDEICRHSIRPELLANLIRVRLGTGRFSAAASGAAGARVWLCQPDPDGFMDLASLSGHDQEERTVWLRLLRHHLRRFLDAEGAFQPSPCPQPLPETPGLLRETAPAAEQAAALLELLRQQGKVLEVNPLPMMRERFMGTWNKVRSALLSTRRLQALALLWEYRTQAPGLDLPAVGAVAGDFAALLEGLLADLRRQGPSS